MAGKCVHHLGRDATTEIRWERYCVKCEDGQTKKGQKHGQVRVGDVYINHGKTQCGIVCKVQKIPCRPLKIEIQHNSAARKTIPVQQSVQLKVIHPAP